MSNNNTQIDQPSQKLIALWNVYTPTNKEY